MVFTRGLDTCVSIEALEMFILPKLVWIKCLWLCASRDAEARRIVFLFENEEKKEKKASMEDSRRKTEKWWGLNYHHHNFVSA